MPSHSMTFYLYLTYLKMTPAHLSSLNLLAYLFMFLNMKLAQTQYSFTITLHLLLILLLPHIYYHRRYKRFQSQTKFSPQSSTEYERKLDGNVTIYNG